MLSLLILNILVVIVCFLCTGGPGSGKVTHCDTLMQEKRGVTHINMMDLLQQYAIGNGKHVYFWMKSILKANEGLTVMILRV